MNFCSCSVSRFIHIKRHSCKCMNEMSEAMAQKVTIKPDDTMADVDRLSARIKLLKKTRDEIREMQAFCDEVEAEIQEELAKRGATVATLNNVPVFTWRTSRQYAFARFRDAYPEIYAQYVVPKTTDGLDEEKLLQDHGHLLRPFQTRRFEYV